MAEDRRLCGSGLNRNPLSHLVLLMLGATGSPVAAQQVSVDSLLVAGDTAGGIALLRTQARGPAARCLLATLITARTTSRREDWRQRLEAQQLFEQSLKERLDPGCMLAFAGLKEKQGIRIDAGRLARRAMRIAEDHPGLATPALRAEGYYRRAIPIAEWVRNFERLVAVGDLPVSSGNCPTSDGYFCESVEHPWLFFERLMRGTRLDALVADERQVLAALVDSAWRNDPAHPAVFRLAAREAAVAADWDRLRALAHRGLAARPAALDPALALLAALVNEAQYELAAAAFDTIAERLGPEGMAAYEGLGLITDPAVREQLQGWEGAAYAEAMWVLSDPLYLTPWNERRVEHYARVFLADLLFGDPVRRVDGRHTDQGELLIRYGFPKYWFEVKADRALELTPEQRDLSRRLLACATTPVPGGGGPECAIPGIAAQGQRIDGGGRWTFWFYDSLAPPFVFERALGHRIARHKMFTESRALDDRLARTAPSRYVGSFRPAFLSVLLTRFPRPHRPVLEVHARFAWPAGGSGDSAEVGIFVHDRRTGRLVQRLAADVRVEDTSTSLAGTVSVPWGGLRIAVEGLAPASNTATQLRRSVDLLEPVSGALTVSDLLLGDSAFAPPAPSGRSAVRFWARSDSVYNPDAPLALYWETYGLNRLTSDSLDAAAEVRFHVRLQVLDAGGRPVLTELWRGARELLGIRRTDETTFEWELSRRTPGNVVPALLVLTAPRGDGRYRLALEITDMIDGRTAHAERVVMVTRHAAPTEQN